MPYQKSIKGRNLKLVSADRDDEKYLVDFFFNKNLRIYSDLMPFIADMKNDNFIEFKVHLIYSKQVPLLNSAVLIYAMKELDWWLCPSLSQLPSFKTFYLATVMLHADCMCKLLNTLTVNSLHV